MEMNTLLTILIISTPIIFVMTMVASYKIATGTDKPTVRNKAKAVELMNQQIFPEDKQKTTIIQHILRQSDSHHLIVKRPTGYYHITIYNVNDQYYYRIEEIYKSK